MLDTDDSSFPIGPVKPSLLEVLPSKEDGRKYLYQGLRKS